MSTEPPPTIPEFYTDEEIALLREQKKRGNAEALRVMNERDYPLHPRIALLKKKEEAVLNERCPTCAQPVHTIFDHIDTDCEHA